MENMMRFAFWFLIELAGSWVIWATFLAIKFISEDSEGQKASFGLVNNSQIGAFIALPIIATVVWTIAAVGIATVIQIKID